MKHLVATVFYVTWLMGFVFAKGFWSTLCCLIPPYAHYILIEHYLL